MILCSEPLHACTGCDKVEGQLNTVKALLDKTASAQAATGWPARQKEYNELLRDFKRIRDLPRNLNG